MPTVKKKSSTKKKAPVKKAAAKKTAARKKAPVKKTASKKASAKKATAKKTVAKKKAPVKKTTAKKTAIKKKAPAKKATAKKTAAKKKAPVKKATAKKTAAGKKTPVKKVTSKAKPKGTLAKAVKSSSDHSTPVEGFATYKLRKGEEYMNEEQNKHFRQLLRAWKMDLMQEVDRTVHHMQDEAANFPDPNDRATQESEFSLELRTRDRERKLIKKIDESIGLLDTDEFGYCESCGVEIGVRRLEARPTATQCIDCKTLDEIREKQRG
ncbi:MAG TPA: RNA polymerase-binding protein DksA [Gammaproteobacteria bacterium]|nr:RNA polymerase-binding protein DksA [Gammaproteobacteria bacterium]